jgi:hypothetical protein
VYRYTVFTASHELKAWQEAAAAAARRAAVKYGSSAFTPAVSSFGGAVQVLLG